MKTTLQLALFVLSGSLFGSEVHCQNIVSIQDPKIQYQGRIDFSDGQTAKWDWPGIVVEMMFEGSSISILLEDKNNQYDIFIDDQKYTTLKTKEFTNEYVLAQGLAKGKHHLRMVKRTESNWHIAKCKGFVLEDGKTLLALDTKPSRHIEFIGDSYTVGYGNESPGKAIDVQDESGRLCTDEELMQRTNTDKAFGPIVARYFGAQYQINAYSGLGLVRHYNGNTDYAPFLDYYAKTLNSQKDSPQWDFSKWKADVVVIGLGINDFSTAPGADEALYRKTYHTFLDNIRARNPGVKIICIATNLWPDDKMRPNVQRVVTEQKAKGHQDIHYLGYENTGYGCGWHPDLKAHQLIADQLIEKIEKIKTWNKKD